MPFLPVTAEKPKPKKNSWMSSLARTTNGVKTCAMSVENLEGLSEMFTTPPAVQMTSNNFPGEKHSGNWLSSLAKATIGPRKRGMPVEDLQGVPEMFATPPLANAGSDCYRAISMRSLPSTDEEAMVEIRGAAPLDPLQVKAEAASPDKSELHMAESLAPTKTPSLRSSEKDTTHIGIVSPIKSSCTPSLRSGRKQTSKSAVTPGAVIEIGEVLKPNKTPSLRYSAKDTVTVQVVTPVQLPRTPSLRSARTLACIQNSVCSDLELEIVQPIAPSRTPSRRFSAEKEKVVRKSIGNPTEDRKSPGLREQTRLMKSPKESNCAESVEDFFVPNMFASPKPQPKRYSRKSEGLQGVTRLLRTPDAENKSTGESPKLDGIKLMPQPEKSLASPHFVGLKALMKTPKICQRRVDPEEHFTVELFTSPVQDSSQDTTQSAARRRTTDAENESTGESPKLDGIKLMLQPEKSLASPHFVGLKALMKTPKICQRRVDPEEHFTVELFTSPVQDSSQDTTQSAARRRTTDAENESTGESPKLDGIKLMLQPEKSLASPHFVGLKALMKTPKICQRRVDPEEHFTVELFASPVQDSSQDTTQSAARSRKDKKRSVPVIRLTSSKTEATTAQQSGNIVSETLPRTTRSKRKAPEDPVEPVPKRVRRTRSTVKQQNEGKAEARSNSKAGQKNTAAKRQKKTAAVIQSAPKPFVFKRTKLDTIIEVQSPLPSLDDAIEISTSSSLIVEAEKVPNEERKTGNAPKTRKQSKAPIRSSRRGNRCTTPAETPVEDFTKKKVAEKYLETKRNESVIEYSTNTGDSQKAPVKTPQPNGERKRETRNTKANGNSLNTMAPPIKTRMTRNQRAKIADLEEEVVNCSFMELAVNIPAPRWTRGAAKTTKERAQVLGKTKRTRGTVREEILDEAADLVPENRSTRASRKQANKNRVVENDSLARSTGRKNSGKEEVKELEKEETTNKMKHPPEAMSTRRTRGNSAHKANFEGDDACLENNSSKKSRAKRELKRSTTNDSRETMSTRSRKAAEDQVEFTEQSMHSKVGTKRSHQEKAGTPPPEPKRTRASVRAQSGPNTRITRSHSQK